jgi:hypothetical protein
MTPQQAIQYLAFDVHQATIVANCRDADGKVVLRATVATAGFAVGQELRSACARGGKFRARAIATKGTAIYRPSERAQWLAQLEVRARVRAAALFKHLDRARLPRPY